MATMVSGSQGQVALPSTVMGATIVVNTWEATIEHEVFDATPFSAAGAASTNFRVKAHGLAHLTGTCSGWMLDSIVPEIGNIASLNQAPTALFELITVTASTDKSYNFSGVIGSMAISVDKRSEATVTLSFESSGTITTT